MGAKDVVRGIPVRKWQSCSYSKGDLKEYFVTAYFSGKKKQLCELC